MVDSKLLGKKLEAAIVLIIFNVLNLKFSRGLKVGCSFSCSLFETAIEISNEIALRAKEHKISILHREQSDVVLTHDEGLKPWVLSVILAVAQNVVDAIHLLVKMTERTEEGIKHAPPPTLSVLAA